MGRKINPEKWCASLLPARRTRCHSPSPECHSRLGALVVEASRTMQTIVEKSLAKSGIVAVCVASEAGAEKALQTGKFDLLILGAAFGRKHRIFCPAGGLRSLPRQGNTGSGAHDRPNRGCGSVRHRCDRHDTDCPRQTGALSQAAHRADRSQHRRAEPGIARHTRTGIAGALARAARRARARRSREARRPRFHA